MILPIVLLITGVVALLAFFLYGRAYWWAYRASRWKEVDQALASGTDDGQASSARHLTRRERVALGTPFSNALVALLGIFSIYGAIALFRSGDPQLAVYGALCCLGLAVAVVLFLLLDRMPTVVRARTLRGVLSYPSADMTYIPPGGMYVGGVPVLYPLHWDRFVQADVGQSVEIELTEHGDVLRHGSRLSIDAEASKFKSKPWVPAAHAAVALTVLFFAALFVYAPLGERVDAAGQALAAHRYLEVAGTQDWQDWQPRVGDELTVSDVLGSCALTASAAGVVSNPTDAAGGRPAGSAAPRPTRASPSTPSETLASMFRCDQVSFGLPAQQAEPITLTAQQETAERLSRAMEQVLLTRRNATSQEVRRYFRQAGQGSSQRYTLSDVDPVAADIDALCPAGACPAREALAEALAAPAAQNPDTPQGALVMDGASATRFVQASFALAAITLDEVNTSIQAQARARQQSAQRVVHSATGTPLGAVPTALAWSNDADRALLEQVGLQSPRLRLLLTQQALQGLAQHEVRWSGAIREVDAQAQPERVVVDTGVIPSRVWVKLAPLILLGTLIALALLSGVSAWLQWRAQRRNIAQIVAEYAR